MNAEELTKEEWTTLGLMLKRKEADLLWKAINLYVNEAYHRLAVCTPTDVTRIANNQTVIREVPRIFSAIREVSFKALEE